MSLVVVETVSDTPLYPENPTASDLRTLDCIMERQGKWRYSLVASDRHRTICTFEAPDVESIRESYRRGGTVFSCMWPGEAVMPEQTGASRNEATLVVVESHVPSGSTLEEWHSTNDEIRSLDPHPEIEWIRTYVSRDRTRVIDELNASDAEVVRETYRRLNVPFNRVWSARLVKP